MRCIPRRLESQMSNALLVALLRARLIVRRSRHEAKRAAALLVAAGMRVKHAIAYVLDLAACRVAA
jgi:hypothetical protein